MVCFSAVKFGAEFTVPALPLRRSLNRICACFLQARELELHASDKSISRVKSESESSRSPSQSTESLVSGLLSTE